MAENITVLTAPLISEWDVESCYPWAELPDREFHFPNTTHQDVGIDAVAVRRKMDVRYSITIRQHKSLRHLIEAISEADWTPIPYWMDGAADVAETTYIPFQTEPDAAPVRLIVRRVKPTPGSQLALFASYSYHGFITDRDGETLELEADHRRHAEVENAIRDLKYGVGLNHMPSGRFAANGAWRAATVSTTPMRCVPVGRPVFSAAWSRRHPPWAPSCAASAGGTSASWTGVSRELLARAWAAGAGPGDGPLIIDIDSTICETYGLGKEGARHHGYTGQRGYHPLLAVAAGTGEVLMARLREGRANTARGRGPLPAGDHQPGALRRGQGTAHGAGRQRFL